MESIVFLAIKILGCVFIGSVTLSLVGMVISGIASIIKNEANEYSFFGGLACISLLLIIIVLIIAAGLYGIEQVWYYR